MSASPTTTRRACAFALGVGAAVLLALDARAQQTLGVIRGRVEVRRTQTAVPRPNVNDLGPHAAHGAPSASAGANPAAASPAGSAASSPASSNDARRAVVYLESAPARAFQDLEPGRATMDQRNERFVPHVLAVTVGTTVDFPNSDNTYHNVFSLRGPRPFDLGRYAAGKSRSVRFDRPGIVRVFCEIHSHMSAFILVFSHRYYAVAAADGRYQIGRVPPGRYTLVAWNDGRVRESRQVVVPDDGGVVEADFSLR